MSEEGEFKKRIDREAFNSVNMGSLDAIFKIIDVAKKDFYEALKWDLKWNTGGRNMKEKIEQWFGDE